MLPRAPVRSHAGVPGCRRIADGARQTWIGPGRDRQWSRPRQSRVHFADALGQSPRRGPELALCGQPVPVPAGERSGDSRPRHVLLRRRPLNTSQMRSWLRDLGARSTYRLEGVPVRDLALQRLLFIARLIAAAGYGGWIVLFDEVELIGRYSFKQRARSYSELARWGGKLKSGGIPGAAASFAITTDFDAAVLQDRGDLETVPGKLRASGVDTDLKLASQAELGMRMIAREPVRLRGPDRAMLERIREQVR